MHKMGSNVSKQDEMLDRKHHAVVTLSKPPIPEKTLMQRQTLSEAITE